jgi:predicted nucleic acid-binding protein
MTAAIVETGPLVAFLDRGEQRHHWVAERFDELDAPLLVCEPVLAEAMYLLARYPKAQDAVLELIQKGAMKVAFRTSTSRNCANCFRNTGTRRCRSPMLASFAWRRFMIDMPS